MASLPIIFSPLLLVLLVVVVMQHVNSEPAKDLEESLGMDSTEMRMRMDRFFVLIDTNDDNVITEEELHTWLGKAKRAAQQKEAIAEFVSIDTDGDGEVSFDQLSEAFGEAKTSDEGGSDLKKRFDTVDLDKNGLLSKDEFQMLVVPGSSKELLEYDVQDILKTDGDKDEKISIQEFLSVDGAADMGAEDLKQFQSEFDTYDLNRDGFIDRDEIRKAVLDPYLTEIAESELYLRKIVAEINGVNETETFSLTKEIWTLHAPRFALTAVTDNGEMLKYPVDYGLKVGFNNLPPIEYKGEDYEVEEEL